MCRPKGVGFASFWSEDGYKFFSFWSGIGYGIEGTTGVYERIYRKGFRAAVSSK